MGKKIYFLLTLLVLFFCGATPASGYTGSSGQCCQDTEQVLRIGAPSRASEDVYHLQQLLNRLGYYHGPVDGIYGPATAGAVKLFQIDRHLLPDGVVGPATWNAIGQTATRPAASQQAPPPAKDVRILIDTTRRTLTVFFDGQPYRQYPVAVGKFETPTPLGNFRVVRKAMHWGTGFGSRWLGLNVPWGLYGIHGTNKPWSIGSYASHGCIRMHNRDVEEIYPWIPVGAQVTITGNPFTYREPPFRDLRRDFCGSDVMEVQRTLARLGLFKGKIDGTWRWDMEESVYRFRALHNLSRDNVIDKPAYRALGF
ncbi:Lipoprotein-anchoring transpeptidase ErfK/SrfK [Desulfofundulus australicus DSM 11792]|uniref:Lipoprotein-anchoring transpeptidase ErfK/SrfK n=1 Tax=Desulfofundulus australicus DSM 11792 TaxID=1121425 RepID=A0A1M4X4C4_9FIRM|nr:peptidoglycan-binding protein [Desulfofundulus australicus]SHE88309.1 Lipoprotein-anchoring transpeptidase ErfK/SrfK [Desulfofundulus australicus DSM 11792]